MPPHRVDARAGRTPSFGSASSARLATLRLDPAVDESASLGALQFRSAQAAVERVLAPPRDSSFRDLRSSSVSSSSPHTAGQQPYPTGKHDHDDDNNDDESRNATGQLGSATTTKTTTPTTTTTTAFGRPGSASASSSPSTARTTTTNPAAAAPRSGVPDPSSVIHDSADHADYVQALRARVEALEDGLAREKRRADALLCLASENAAAARPAHHHHGAGPQFCDELHEAQSFAQLQARSRQHHWKVAGALGSQRHMSQPMAAAERRRLGHPKKQSRAPPARQLSGLQAFAGRLNSLLGGRSGGGGDGGGCGSSNPRSPLPTPTTTRVKSQPLANSAKPVPSKKAVAQDQTHSRSLKWTASLRQQRSHHQLGQQADHSQSQVLSRVHSFREEAAQVHHLQTPQLMLDLPHHKQHRPQQAAQSQGASSSHRLARSHHKNVREEKEESKASPEHVARSPSTSRVSGHPSAEENISHNNPPVKQARRHHTPQSHTQSPQQLSVPEHHETHQPSFPLQVHQSVAQHAWQPSHTLHAGSPLLPASKSESPPSQPLKQASTPTSPTLCYGQGHGYGVSPPPEIIRTPPEAPTPPLPQIRVQEPSSMRSMRALHGRGVATELYPDDVQDEYEAEPVSSDSGDYVSGKWVYGANMQKPKVTRAAHGHFSRRVLSGFGKRVPA